MPTQQEAFSGKCLISQLLVIAFAYYPGALLMIY